MPVRRAAITEGRAAILRSAQLPQRMAAEAVVLALVLLLILLVDAVVASVQRGRQQAQAEQTAQEAEAVAFPPQASIL